MSKISRNEQIFKNEFYLFSNTFKMIYDLLESDKKNTELQPFEGDRISRVDFEKNRVKVF